MHDGLSSKIGPSPCKSDKLLAILFQQGLHLAHAFLVYRNQAMSRTIEIGDNCDHNRHQQRKQQE